MLHLAEDSQESVVSILTVGAPAVRKIINIIILFYFNCLYGKHIFQHYVNAAMSIGMGVA
jgi:hypothetical protein